MSASIDSTIANSISAHPPARAGDGFFHPSSEAQLVALIRWAAGERLQVRVRGAAHSVAAAIFTDEPPRGPMMPAQGRHADVMLDRYARVDLDPERGRVTVQAGCHLGLDPRDPTRTSTWESSLLAQLEARGWALPDLGGVAHQTVAGFFMTGSCGGTVRHAIEDAVLAIRLIDGTGRIHVLERDRDPLFFAAICSMGLLGIVSSITLQCVPDYDVIGREDVTPERACAYELFGDGDHGLEGFLRRTEYARLMWWPQEGVRRVVTWQARRMSDADYSEMTGARGELRPKRYSALGDAIRNPRLSRAANLAGQAVGGAFYDGIARASRSASLRGRTRERVKSAFVDRVLPLVLRQFVPLGPAQHFWDRWCHGLPMDEQMSERSLPTEFTEIWVPLDRAGEVMRALRAHYDRAGYDATGAFICEIYAARAARAWMHPGYGRDSLRIDLFWFARNHRDPVRTWFVQFWELLRPFAYRLHWGKYLPVDPELGARHLRRNTPRWDDFLAARAQLDPKCVFLTRYWREALGL